jgi:hypothetical protein
MQHLDDSTVHHWLGRPIHFNMCEWGLDGPWEWGGQYAQTWRVFGDHHGIWNGGGGTRDVVNQSMYLPAELALGGKVVSTPCLFCTSMDNH